MEKYVPVPNPSETSSLKMMEVEHNIIINGNASTNDMFILSSKLIFNLKVVWIALSEDDQEIYKK